MQIFDCLPYEKKKKKHFRYFPDACNLEEPVFASSQQECMCSGKIENSERLVTLMK